MRVNWHTSSSTSKRVKPPNFGSSGIGGGVVIEMSAGGFTAMISSSSSSFPP
jgi:hypothetical protein